MWPFALYNYHSLVPWHETRIVVGCLEILNLTRILDAESKIGVFFSRHSAREYSQLKKIFTHCMHVLTVLRNLETKNGNFLNEFSVGRNGVSRKYALTINSDTEKK